MNSELDVPHDNDSSSCNIAPSSENDSGPTLDQLKEYTRIKLGIASQLRVLHDLLKNAGNEHCEKQCMELHVKLAEDRFTLAVVGQFKRGKSSLLNAIIGRDLLPTGVLPLTSAITILKFGPEERLVIEPEDGAFNQITSIEELANFVTEKGNPGNRRRVKTATIEVPLPFLRRGLEFVDTPGVGSAIEANTVTTTAFLPKCDAVIFVTSVESPFTSVEIEFLQKIRQFVHKIFFVVNKIDLLQEEEPEEVLNFVTQTIRDQCGASEVRLFPVSCRQALLAKRDRDETGYQQSGLTNLEATLSAFLSEEKMKTFLAAVAANAVRILDDVTNQGSVAPDPEFSELRQRFSALHDETLQIETKVTICDPVHFTNTKQVTVPSPVSSEEIDFARNLSTRGCPLCDHLHKMAYDFFRHQQYALASNNKAREQFAADLGYCAAHFWQMEALSSPLGASVGYSLLVERVAKVLAESAASSDPLKSLDVIPKGSHHCRVCQILQGAEREYVLRLIDHLHEQSGRDAYARSQGFCLGHLRMFCELASDNSLNKFVLAEAARHFEELSEDMVAFAMKRDALRKSLNNADERDAYWRALTHLVGDKYLALPIPDDLEI